MIEKKNKNKNKKSKKIKKGGESPYTPSKTMSPFTLNSQSYNYTPIVTPQKSPQPFTGKSYFLSKPNQKIVRRLNFGNNHQPLEKIPSNFIKYPNRTEVPSNYFTNPKKYEKIIEELKKKQGTIPQSIIMSLKEESNLFNFLSDYFDQLFIETNSDNFLNKVLNILKKTNQEFKEFNNFRLINLFTEEFIFIKKDASGDLLIEPLIFSLMEMNVFKDYSDLFSEEEEEFIDEEHKLLDTLFNNNASLANEKENKDVFNYLKRLMKNRKSKFNHSEQKRNLKKQIFVNKMLIEGYDIELNPMFIDNIEVFKILQNFFNKKKTNGKKQNAGALSFNEKIRMETVRQNIDSAHNFMGSLNSINQTIIFDFERKKNLMQNKISKKIRSTNTDTCQISRPLITNFDFTNEKAEVLSSLQKKRQSKNPLVCYTIDNISKKKYFNGCFHDIEEQYLLFLMNNNLVGNNVYYFIFDRWDNSVKYVYLKELLYNALGRFQFIINDASNLSHIISFAFEKITNPAKDDLLYFFRIYFLLKTGILKDKKIYINKESILLSKNKNGKKVADKNALIKNIIDDFKSKLTKIKNQHLKNIQEFKKKEVVELIDSLKNIKNKILELKKIANNEPDKLNEVNIQKLKNDFETNKKKLNTLQQIIYKSSRLQKIREELFNNIKLNSNASSSTNINKIKEVFNKSIVSFGMKLDPGSALKTAEIELFDPKIYKKLLKEIFDDLQLENCEISFNINLNNEPKLKSSMENLQIKNLKTITFVFTKNSINYPVIFNVDRDFNTVSIIYIIIKVLIEIYKIEILIITRKKNEEKVVKKKLAKIDIPFNNRKIFNKKFSEFNKNKLSKSKILNKCKKIYKLSHPSSELNNETFDSYFDLVTTLFSLNYKFIDVIRFVLRIKIMGDKIQALEAKYNCSLIDDFGANIETDIKVKHRILATQDRPLLAYALVENNVNFISKATLNNKKIMFWNFGDAFTVFTDNNLRNIKNSNIKANRLPILPFFSLNEKHKTNNLKHEFNINNFYQKINVNPQYLNSIIEQIKKIKKNYNQKKLSEQTSNEENKLVVPEYNEEEGEENKLEVPEYNENEYN